MKLIIENVGDGGEGVLEPERNTRPPGGAKESYRNLAAVGAQGVVEKPLPRLPLELVDEGLSARLQRPAHRRAEREGGCGRQVEKAEAVATFAVDGVAQEEVVPSRARQDKWLAGLIKGLKPVPVLGGDEAEVES